jgi:hypothetical protein
MPEFVPRFILEKALADRSSHGATGSFAAATLFVDISGFIATFAGDAFTALFSQNGAVAGLAAAPFYQ